MAVTTATGSCQRWQGGFTYLALLFFVAIFSASLAAAAVLWSTMQQRQQEQELLFIGASVRQAIGLYYQKTPGTIKHYPNRLEDLLQDNRQATVNRYLRKIERDPFTGQVKWGLVRAPDGGIMGIYSESEKAPIKRHFGVEGVNFLGTKKYSEWRFIYEPPV